MRFLLLYGLDDNFLKDFLIEVLKPLGSLSVASVTEGVPPGAEEPDGLIIIDATAVERAEHLVARLLSERPERRIVVLTASPTWQRARAVFEAGAMDYLPSTLRAEEMRDAFQQALRSPAPR
jgi:DNA-binding NarL/FixJ family response regulator